MSCAAAGAASRWSAGGGPAPGRLVAPALSHAARVPTVRGLMATAGGNPNLTR
jgi:hypothetical protein